MQQNLQVKRLPNELFRAVEEISNDHGLLRFLDPSRHLSFDIFDEENDQPVENSAPWD